MTNPKCINPNCGRRKTVRVVAADKGGSEYFCSHCGTHFDDNPNEGGDVYADPSKRMERAEARRDRKH